jgi:hypothetical protein
VVKNFPTEAEIRLQSFMHTPVDPIQRGIPATYFIIGPSECLLEAME